MIFSCALCLGVWTGVAVRFGSMQPELAVNTGLVGGVGGFTLGALLIQKSFVRLLAWFLLGVLFAVTLGAFLVAFSPWYLESSRSAVVEMGLAGLRAAPVCFVIDKYIQYLDN